MGARLWLSRSLVAALSVAAGLIGCGGGGGGASAPAPVPVSGGAPPAPRVPASMVAFKVVDTSGRVLPGVIVQRRDILGVEQATTDANGRATLPTHVVANIPLWEQQKEGFVTQLQKFFLGTNNPITQSVVMMPRDAAVTLPDARTGGTVIGKHGVALTLAPNGLVGSSGPIGISLTPIDIAQSDIAAAPNTTFRFTPWDYNDDALLSYGMVELIVRDARTAAVAGLLQPATIDIPLYVTQHPDGQPISAGQRIAVATFDDTSRAFFDGQWQPMGDGEVVASAASPTGFALRTTIPSDDGAGSPLTLNAHFSAMALTGSRSVDVNIVPPASETLPSGSLYRVWGNVSSRGGPQAAFDQGRALLRDVGANGYPHSLWLPLGPAFDVRAEVVVGTTTYFGTTQIAAATPQGGNVQLNLRRVTQLSPFITYPSGNPSVRVGTKVSVKVEFSGPQPNRVQLFADQILIGELTGQRAFYTFEWDTTGLSPATRRLSAVAHDATSSGRSSEVHIVLVN